MIVAVDGAAVDDPGGLNFRIGTNAPGETVAVTLLRQGQERTVQARVERLPGDPDLSAARVIDGGALAGAQVLLLNPAVADRLGVDPLTRGVVVGQLARGSYARERVGLRTGDVVLNVNGRAVTSLQQLADVQRGARLTILRGGREIEGTIR